MATRLAPIVRIRREDRASREGWESEYTLDDDSVPALPGLYWYEPLTIVLRPIPTVAEEIELVMEIDPPVLETGTDVFNMFSKQDRVEHSFANPFVTSVSF